MIRRHLPAPFLPLGVFLVLVPTTMTSADVLGTMNEAVVVVA